MTTCNSKVSTARRCRCSACGSDHLEELISLPRLPLTGIFVLPHERQNYPSFDQGLMYCHSCGHCQLRESVDPSYLYQDTYTHRSSLSPISTRGNDFFLNFVKKITGSCYFDSIVEIGCNDLYLLRKLHQKGKVLTGFDPIWKDRVVGPENGIRVKGKYIEEVEPEKDFPKPPDLVLSVHTLEHVDNPFKSLIPIFEYAKPGALFVFEVPSLDTLLRISRFDQVFHQHLNYFSLASMCRMIHELGGEYLNHCFNYDYWLGTMLVAFKKPDSVGSIIPVKPPMIRKDQVISRYNDYRASIASVSRELDYLAKIGQPIVGFGAAQMVPTFAYHLSSDLSCLDAIVDDNSDKAGRTYPSVATTIRPFSEFQKLDNHAVLITALDSARTILNRMSEYKAKSIIIPSTVM